LQIVCLLERGLPVGAALGVTLHGVVDFRDVCGEILLERSVSAECHHRHTYSLRFRQSGILGSQQFPGERVGSFFRIAVAFALHAAGLVHDQHNVGRCGSGDRGGGAIAGCGQMQRVLIADDATGFHDALVVRRLHIGIHDGHVTRRPHGERAGFGVCTIAATLLRHWGTVRGHGVAARVQLPHPICGAVSEIIGLDAGELTLGQRYHTVIVGLRIELNLIGVRIVHAVFTLVRIFGTVDEQLELELFVRVDGA